MLALALTFVLMGNPPTYKITNIHKTLEGHGERLMDAPLALEKVGDDLFVFDKSYQLWALDLEGDVLNTFGSKADTKTAYTTGVGPGEFAMGFENLYIDGDELIVIHTSGYRLEKFGLDAGYRETQRLKYNYIYYDEKVKIRSKAIPTGTRNKPILPIRAPVTIDDKKGIWEIDIVDPKLKDVPSFAFTFAKKWGDFLLINSPQGIHKTIHYLVYDLKHQTIHEHASVRMLDPRISLSQERVASDKNPGNLAVPILMGCTTSDTLGYVLTEHTLFESYRIIRTYHPVTKKWGAMKIKFEDHFGDMTFFQHLGGNRWAAYAGDALVFFEIGLDP